MSITSAETALAFYRALHQELAGALCDSASVRARVEALREINPFRESCFCKAFLLPVVDRVATTFLNERFGASRCDVRQALRCEGYATPMYECGDGQVGFSSHSRSNSYHAGDKSGRRQSSRRSPDFCIRYPKGLRIVGEVKYIAESGPAIVQQVVRELRDYLSITGEDTSDWGHDFGIGIVYAYGADRVRDEQVVTFLESDRILVTAFVLAGVTG